jgi:hypothetical protein
MHKKVRPAAKPKLQSREATAEELNIHIRTVDRLLNTGRLKGVKLGRRRMVVTESAQTLAAGE